ncbi:MAG: response regulator [Clostridiales Family XIII bacterium]|jgi:YesN/AraC family two-component response regulator|nr:response regulator [Clostridiales Family XIII bacterium]
MGIYKVLLVDDEPLIRKGIQAIIARRCPDLSVTAEAVDGEEALAAIAKAPPDLVISDIKMDGMNGCILADRINTEYPDILNIILTGYDDFAYAQEMIRYNVFAYLLKPVDTDEFVEILGTAKLEIEKRRRLSLAHRVLDMQDPAAQIVGCLIDDDRASDMADSDALKLVKCVKDYVNAHIEGDLSLPTMGRLFHFNPSYFSNLFKQATGENYVSYVTKKRVGKAIEQMQNTDFNIGEIAEKSGYQNANYFCRMFKKNTGMTPSEFRNKMLRE